MFRHVPVSAPAVSAGSGWCVRGASRLLFAVDGSGRPRGGEASLFRAYLARAGGRVDAGAVRAPDCPRARVRGGEGPSTGMSCFVMSPAGNVMSCHAPVSIPRRSYRFADRPSSIAASFHHRFRPLPGPGARPRLARVACADLRAGAQAGPGAGRTCPVRLHRSICGAPAIASLRRKAERRPRTPPLPTPIIAQNSSGQAQFRKYYQKL